MKKIIDIIEGVPRQPLFRLKNPVTISMMENENWAIVGPNASGKSMFADILTSAHPLLMTEPHYDFSPSESNRASDNIKYVTFKDTYGDASDMKYYQQRWNHGDVQDEQPPTVGELLESASHNEEVLKKIKLTMRTDSMLNKVVMMLSSGEFRRFQLAKALLTSPRLLLLDNPFIGLDIQARKQVTSFLEDITSSGMVQTIVLLSNDEDIPEYISHVVRMENMDIIGKYTRKEYFETYVSTSQSMPTLSDEQKEEIKNLPYSENAYHSEEVINFRNINIAYGERRILKDLNWKVDNGEMWALKGENGSGKSTLLSLVCCDNPQGYACDISLFGNKRGSGESIWDIKKHIGYVSPEMYRAYKKDLPVIDIIASGLHDTVGLYVRSTQQQLDTCRWWMNIFGISHLAERPYLKISSGEQRMVLLARAFVKDPELLILDEPFHGLDPQRCQRAKDIIEAFCNRKGKTMIMVSHYDRDFPKCITGCLSLVKQK